MSRRVNENTCSRPRRGAYRCFDTARPFSSPVLLSFSQAEQNYNNVLISNHRELLYKLTARVLANAQYGIFCIGLPRGMPEKHRYVA